MKEGVWYLVDGGGLLFECFKDGFCGCIGGERGGFLFGRIRGCLSNFFFILYFF